MAKKKSGLGRGLNSLLGESIGEISSEENEATSHERQPEKPTHYAEPAQPSMNEPQSRDSNTISLEQPDKDDLNHQAAPTPELASQTVSVVNDEEMKPPVAEEAKGFPTRANNPQTLERKKPRPASKPIDEEARKALLKEKEEEVVEPYFEESDNIVIKEIHEREVLKETEEVDIDTVKPNPDQPRTHFDHSQIEELAASIQKDGLLQPILVRKVGSTYQIIAGERRWQACKSLHMEKVPIRVKDVTDDKAIELALIENIQRADLNPIEEAYGYKRMMERKRMTQSDVAQAVSKGRSTVANALRLLELPEDAQQLLFEEKITAGHARAILSVPTQEGRQRLTEKLEKEKLSVRETETLARLYSGQAKAGTSGTKREPTPQYFKKAAKGLREKLQTNVRIKSVKGKNKIEIEFKDEDDLDRLIEQLTDLKAEKLEATADLSESEAAESKAEQENVEKND